jgi:hypothetical protein
MLAWVVIFSIDSRRPTHCRHVTKIPSPQLLLFPALTNRDACNPFRIRSYANCRVAYALVLRSSILRTFFQVPYPATPLFATLTQTAGVCTNNSHSGTHPAAGQVCLPRSNFKPPTSAFSHPCALSCALLHFFAISKNSTPISFQPFPHSCAKTSGVRGLLLTRYPSSQGTLRLFLRLSDSVNSALSAPSALIPVLYPGQSLGVEGSRLHLGRTSVLTSLVPYVLTSLHPYFVTSLLPLPRGNSIGSAGGVSAMASSCGYRRRSGSGTFTFDPVRLLMSCRALTTDLP